MLGGGVLSMFLRRGGVSGCCAPDRGALQCVVYLCGRRLPASRQLQRLRPLDSDEWMGWSGELGVLKSATDYGVARRRLSTVRQTVDEIARPRRHENYGGSAAASHRGSTTHPSALRAGAGERRTGDLVADGGGRWVYGDHDRRFEAIPAPTVPRRGD